jgi:hypothetical protein
VIQTEALPLDLAETYLHLSDGESVSTVEVGEDFWANIGGRTPKPVDLW